MFNQLHAGLQVSLPVDISDLTTLYADFVAGRLVGWDANGALTLAGTDATEPVTPVGVLINDAQGGFYGNRPTNASEKIAVMLGHAVIQTDQFVAADFVTSVPAGTPVYVAVLDDNPGLFSTDDGANPLPSVGYIYETTGDVPSTITVKISM